jgi:multicomponent K+:H+ antiporter subunit A
MSLILLLALPFGGSLVAALLPTNARNVAAIWAAIISLAVLVQLAMLFPDARDGE